MRPYSSLLRTSTLLAAILTAALTGARADEPSPSPSAQSDEIRELRAEVRALESKLDTLEQKEEQREKATAAASTSASAAVAARVAIANAPSGITPYEPANAAEVQVPVATELTPGSSPYPKITIDDTGFSFASADGGTFIRLHGLVQADSRWFDNNDGGIANNDTFLIRRARLIFEGGFDKIFSFLIVPEFGGGGTGTSNAPVIYDANLGIAVTPNFKIVAGKFKSPVGLELLQNDAALLFDERSLATNLVPSRDVGILATGPLFNKTVNYTVGVVNGSADAGYTNNTDVDNNKDFVGRLFFTPFINDPQSVLANLGFGIGGSYGLQNKTGSLTSGYKSDGQQTFFTYRSTVLPTGEEFRVSPQANYYSGSFSAQAEYTVSSVTAVTGTSKAQIDNSGWQGALGYILTGEKASYNGFTPKHNFNWSDGTWGAWEVGVRIAQLKIDGNAFPVFADPAASAREATSYGVGLNWYLSKAIRVSFDLVDTQFDRAPGAKTTTNLLIGNDEKALLTRFQVGF
jgi:phosphate-selective porin OprO/OprP